MLQSNKHLANRAKMSTVSDLVSIENGIRLLKTRPF